VPDPSFPSPARALLALLGALLVLAPGRSLGEDRPLTLAEALEMADRRNPELGAARDRADAQAARAEGVDRMRWPRLALESRWFRTDNPSMVFASKLNAGEFTEDDFAISRLNSPEALSHLTTFLSLEAPLDVFGKVRAQSDGQAAFGCGWPRPTGGRSWPGGRWRRPSGRWRERAPGRRTWRPGPSRERPLPPTSCGPGRGGARGRPTSPSKGARSGWPWPVSRASSAPPRGPRMFPSTGRPPPRPWKATRRRGPRGPRRTGR